MYNREYTPGKITELKPNEIFVFGSNLGGMHGGGAARVAYQCFGAVWGQGVGLQGQCYAIPTMQGGVETIKPYVDEFIEFAKANQNYKFFVTRIGCGIAGFRDADIAPLFKDAIDMENVILPRSFVEIVKPKGEEVNTLQDRIRGSLIGGAIGDALGYPVEFMSITQIKHQYGERGITRLDNKRHWSSKADQADKAVVSDDTQMTLFTANGILNAKARAIQLIEGICRAYVEWYQTQVGEKSPEFNECWIGDIPELNCNRAPGSTCMSALMNIYQGQEPVNNSKGCGGVMRIAPIPLYATVDNRMSIEEVDRLAAESAKITHLHPLGYISSALASHVIYRLALDANPTRENMKHYIVEGVEAISKEYKNFPNDVKYMAELAERAVALVDNNKTDLENVRELGEGWVGEETLAIALYCALKYFDNFEDAMIASVNHGGDSDSTGAVTGNILGAAIGYEAIPQFYKDDLEMHDLILHMADDLFRGEVTKM